MVKTAIDFLGDDFSVIPEEYCSTISAEFAEMVEKWLDDIESDVDYD